MAERVARRADVIAMAVAEKVLIVGGVLNLAYGALLGYPIIMIRAKGAPAVPGT
jgi:hypothetical protein